MNSSGKYKVLISKDAKDDIKKYKRYIIIEGMEVYYKPCNTYLIFYVVQQYTIIVIRVLKDSMNWQSIIKRIKNINR